METKHKIGESVWFMYANKPQYFEIEGISTLLGRRKYPDGSIVTTGEKPIVNYHFADFSNPIAADSCHTTKEALLESLMTLHTNH